MNQEDIIKLAREAGFISPDILCCKRFAALVAAAEQEKMMGRIRNIIVEAEQRGAAAEREACAKLADEWPRGHDDVYLLADAIRARGNT